jgi:hypothetical protein
MGIEPARVREHDDIIWIKHGHRTSDDVFLSGFTEVRIILIHPKAVMMPKMYYSQNWMGQN